MTELARERKRGFGLVELEFRGRRAFADSDRREGSGHRGPQTRRFRYESTRV